MQAVKPSLAREYVIDLISAGLVPFLQGSPGMGKSALIKSIADHFGLQLIDERVSQCDPVDLKGFPKVIDGATHFIPIASFPTRNTPKPKGKNGWLLFLDETNSAPKSVLAALYKILYDRMVGNEELHPHVAIVCAGNLESDNAVVEELPTPVKSRVVHIQLANDAEEWVEWATKNGIDYRITAYINYRPDMVNNFNPDSSDETFACQRTWEFCSNLIKQYPKDIPDNRLPLLEGTIGQGVAQEFLQFTRVFDELPDLNNIINNPDSAEVPDQPSTLYAISAVLAAKTNDNNVNAFMQYVNRMPKEFQIITIREMANRYPALETNEKFLEKVAEIATVL